MKKIISSLSAASLLLTLLIVPAKTHAAECNSTVEDVTDYTVEVTADIYFRKTIQGAADETCPESQVIGSFSSGQVLWVLGEIETGSVINEETKETGSWLYVKHPTNGEYGFIWSKNAKKIDVPEDEKDHIEVVVEGEEADESSADQKECETITDVTDFFVKATDGLNIRNGICNGKIISSLGNGDMAKVIGEIEDWYYIEIPGGGKGFIHSDYTEKIDTPEDREGEAEVTIGADEKAYVGPEPSPSESGTLKDIIGHPYETAIRYLEKNNIVEGYPDGLFKADITINRAEFAKIVVGAKLKAEPFSSKADCFPDVSKDAWYASYVCYAKDSGIVSGYPDGNFKPGDSINFVEAAKILTNTFALQKGETTDVWYEVYVEALQKNNYIPSSIKKLDQLVNRGELSEMMWRILEKVTNKSATQFDLKTGQNTNPTPEASQLAACTDNNVPTSIDMTKVREEWLKWHNDARTKLNLTPLVLHEGLNYSSSVWAQDNKTNSGITHDRPGDMTANEWFKDLGITFKQIAGFVFAENIGVQTYTCTEADCTDEAIAATKSLFDAFMKEEGTTSTKHYDNIVEPDYKQIGVGIAIDQTNNKLYLTTHLAQAVETYPSTCK